MICILSYFKAPGIFAYLTLASALFYLFIVSFFRVPERKTFVNQNHIIAPCDGKVVVIEKVFESEYLKKECLQISIFMSPLNVHVNWHPITGEITYSKYHPGKHLVAWHPKSSTDNERTSIAIKHQNGSEILVRQIAGAVARRIVHYTKVGQKVKQGQELGFIKFGSRMDVFVPTDSKIALELEQKSIGKQTLIGSFS